MFAIRNSGLIESTAEVGQHQFATQRTARSADVSTLAFMARATGEVQRPGLDASRVAGVQREQNAINWHRSLTFVDQTHRAFHDSCGSAPLLWVCLLRAGLTACITVNPGVINSNYPNGHR